MDRPKMRASQIKAFILKHVERYPQNIVTFTAEHFGVTRVTAHRHVQALIKHGQLAKSGSTRNTNYFLTESMNKNIRVKITPELSESELWQENFAHLKGLLKENVFNICQYGFTEMVNNAKDHSEGTEVFIQSHQKNGKIIFKIFDNGIGIFRKIKEAKHLKSERESVLQLTKGKFTTDPERHSGEGIFFSSRAFDSFAILANGICYMRDNNEDDWYLESKTEKKNISTLFDMEIRLNSKRVLRDVFARYTDPETHSFDKTHILVDLSKSGEERFVSRSQAKRVLSGLEPFKDILLDFKSVKVVGQAFVDEVFRVFKKGHPEVTIRWINANPDVEFMIKRGVSSVNDERKGE